MHSNMVELEIDDDGVRYLVRDEKEAWCQTADDYAETTRRDKVKLSKTRDGYDITIPTPRTNSACQNRAWFAEIRPDGERQWVNKTRYDSASTKTGGEVSYGPFSEGKEYLYGKVYDGESSNYSYNKHGGLSGAFTIRDGELVDVDEEPIKERERESRQQAKQQRLNDAREFAVAHNLPPLSSQGEVARHELIQLVPDLEQYHIANSDWWQIKLQLFRGMPFGNLRPVHHVQVAQLIEDAKKQMVSQAQSQKLRSHPLCKELPDRVTSVTDSKIRIKTQYGEDFVDDLRELGAKWNRDIKRWELPLDKEEGLREALAEEKD